MPEVIRNPDKLERIHPNDKSAVVLCSGGMDSSSLLALLKLHDFYIIPVTFRYGSKHNDAEYQALLNVCDFLKLNRPIRIDISFLKNFLKSSLLQEDTEVPHGHYAEDNMRSTVVPGRNSIMLSIALGIAQSRNADWIGIANHAGDSYQYQDCRKEYIDHIGIAFSVASEGKVGILNPFVNMDKSQIAALGDKCGLPLEMTWSCYEGDIEKGQCGLCGTCCELHWSKLKAGLEDKTKYQHDPKTNFTNRERKDLGL